MSRWYIVQSAELADEVVAVGVSLAVAGAIIDGVADALVTGIGAVGLAGGVAVALQAAIAESNAARTIWIRKRYLLVPNM